MLLRRGGDESLSRSSSETTTGGGTQLWTGERRQREATPPSQVTASHLLSDSIASHPRCWMKPKRQKREKKPTVLHPVTQQLCCSDDRCLVWSHTVFKRNLYKRRFLSCVTDTFVCWGTIDVSKRVKWCIKYEWICVKCVYKSVDTQLHKEGRLIV